MTQGLQDLLDALIILRGLRKQVHPYNDSYQWEKLYKADRHLEKQVVAHFEEEAA